MTAWRGRAGRRGCPRVFADGAIPCVLTPKVFLQVLLRAALGLAGSLICLTGLDWRRTLASSVSHIAAR
ncbi:transposase [Roseomonas sp. SSH11]|uniref:Transposase n=1 Tax=Pararoseomonas baculiformis TaxID=2820812 RepID=A0ABS4AEH6_9PROT|nr:transposase [Pararoseomonas baculiformis]